MTASRRLLPAALGLPLAACLLLAGCSLGYTNLHPGENSALYAPLFSDIIGRFDEPRWLWVRGSISGDFDGNGKVDREAIVATIQRGTPKNPGPIETAFLAVNKIDQDGKRTAIARTILFDSDPLAAAPRPENDLARIKSIPLTRARAQVIQDKVTLKESVVVYFWGDDLPGGVWYAGYTLKHGELVKNLEVALWQATPGLMTANLDPSIEASPLGYQILFSVAAIPERISAKLGAPREAPLWGHVYARDPDGIYHQADHRFGEHFRELENTWNQAYLRAVLRELPPEELAWFEYYMGIMNHYTGNADMASRFLAKAARGAKDPVLVEAIRTASENIAPGQGGG